MEIRGTPSAVILRARFLDLGMNFRITGRRGFVLGNQGYPVCSMAAAEKGATKIRPIRKSSVSPYSWRAGEHSYEIAPWRPGRRREGAKMALLKQKAAISMSIFGCEMRFCLYDAAHLKVSGFRGVHRQHQTEVLCAPSVRKRW